MGGEATVEHVLKLRKVVNGLVKESPIPNILLYSLARNGNKSDFVVVGDVLRRLNSISRRPNPCYSNFKYLEEESCDLSVIIPVYNTEDYIKDCLESILSQEVSFNLEIIVVNDGSSDNSLDAIQAVATHDSRIRVINQENRGFSGARNVAIDHARGTALCFVDSDDMLAQGHLQTLWDVLQNNECEYVSANYSKINSKGHISKSPEKVRVHGAPWSRMYKREVWSDIRFPEGFWFEDTLIAYCIKTRFREAYIQNYGYLRRLRDDSITATHAKSAKALDGYWVVEEMLDWCRELNISLLKVYEQTIRQFGPLLNDRCSFLNEPERRVLFCACCNLISSTPEWSDLHGTMRGRSHYLEKSFIDKNYRLWLEACKWL